MFVPVTCTHCGKPFQVPETALGRLAPCPWCETVVTALPAAATQPQAEPQTGSEQSRQSQARANAAPPLAKPQAAEASLPLDDEPQSEPRSVAKPVDPGGEPQWQSTALADQAPLSPSPAAPRLLRLSLVIALGVAVAVAVTVFTFGALKRKSGHFVSADWKTFHSPDGSCSVYLLGTPVEDPDVPATGGRLYTSEGWYSGAKSWVGWKNLTTQEAQMATQQEAWRLLRPTILGPEKERLKAAFGGYEAEGGGTKSFQPLVIEYRFQTPEGLLVERAIAKADGLHPRVYFVGMMGKQLAVDGPELERLFSSFRVNE